MFNTKCCLYPLVKSPALCKFEMAMKQPKFVSLHFQYLSNDQDKPSLSTSKENTDACSPSIPDVHGPKKTHNVSF